ncbi:hypothetical protein OG205_16735 [Lentzea sp. NBC_00516]|uniref:hypothetical protein n=1 Tax=Lentzea sp. NBC_00516 TaxID=2903582 RepID=UPI002E823147|nr:hypothetical protein [Lentzea sp. NBC_00516]WUD28582.1 hypothetical protein OG205_16735 [Lentzea sp. NBC_00516]
MFERASGHHYLWGTSGRRYVDLLCGVGALHCCHNHPETVAVIDYLTTGADLRPDQWAPGDRIGAVVTDIVGGRPRTVPWLSTR